MIVDPYKKFQIQLDAIDAADKTQRDKVIAELAPVMEAQIQPEVATGVVSHAAAEQHWKETMDETLKNEESLCLILEGFYTVKKHQEEMLTSEEQTQFKNDLTSCMAQIHTSKTKEPVPNTTIQVYFGVSDSLMNSFHKIGFQLYQRGLWEDAKSVFFLLTTLNPLVPAFFAALAAINYRLGRLNEAMPLAATAVALNGENPRNHLLYANLLIDYGDKGQAKEQIGIAEKLIQLTPSNQADVEDLNILKSELAKAA